MDIKDIADDKLAKIGGAIAIAKVIQSFLGKHAKAGYAQKIAKVPAKAIAKRLIYIELANAGSAKLKEVLPHVDAGFTWVTALPYNVLNQTLGRIPVLGDVFRNIHNWITDNVSKGAKALGWDALADTGSALRLTDPNNGFETEIDWQTGKTINTPVVAENSTGKKEEELNQSNKQNKEQRNSPKLYENLGMHKEFRLPGGYPKSLTAVSENVHVPTVVVHNLVHNANPDSTAMIDRVNQLFTLIKAVRGLSQVGYTTTDIFNYVQFTKFMLVFYYNMKRAVRAAKTYSLVNNGIGDQIIKACGYDPINLRDNLANYESLLCQVHNFISNNLPISGNWVERLTYVMNAMKPDYQDGDLATIHMFGIAIHAFYAAEESPLYYRTSGGMTYATQTSSFRSYVRDFQSNNLWAQIIADYFGAFGGKAIWSDKDYPAYARPLDFKDYSELELDQIKNAVYIGRRCKYRTADSGIWKELTQDSPSVNVCYPTDIFVLGTTHPTVADFTPVTYANILENTNFVKLADSEAISGTPAADFISPKRAGMDSYFVSVTTTPNDHTYTDANVDFSLHKKSLSEGESLELMQFKTVCVASREYIDNGAGRIMVTDIAYTHEYAMIETEAYYPTATSTGYETVEVMPTAYMADELETTATATVFDADQFAVWSLVDWMPRLKTTFTIATSGTISGFKYADLWDVDNFGSLNGPGMQTSVAYSTFSLNGVNLAIAETKRVNNLAEVYKDKSSKKA